MKNILEKENLVFYWNKTIRVYLVLIFSSLFYSFGISFLLQNSKSLPTGLIAIPQTLSIFFDELKPYVQLIFLVLNIPLFVGFYKKIKWKFIQRTIFFLLFNALFGLVFTLIPAVSSFFNEFFKIDQTMGANGLIPIKDSWQGAIYCFVAILICGTSAAFAWKEGGSTGGTDIISYYFSIKYKKGVGLYLTITSFLISTISMVILANVIAGSNNEDFSFVQIVNSYAYVFLVPAIINFIYPKYKKVRVRINSEKIEEIIISFQKTKFHYPYHIIKYESGFKGTKHKAIETVILLIELKSFQEKIRNIDPNAWVSSIYVNSIKGNFDYSSVD
ncbi:MAG: YitT family protein [Metamycoplasmataceae bacterium]